MWAQWSVRAPSAERRHVLYPLDANVLIDAQRDYYPMDRVPEFWGWLVEQAASGIVKIPDEVYRKMIDADDQLAAWLKLNRQDLLLDGDLPAHALSQVLADGYAPDLSEVEVEAIGDDAPLIAHALMVPEARTVVTTEHSRPNRTRANRHIPNVCADMGVPCMNTFDMVRRLDFSTDWRTR